MTESIRIAKLPPGPGRRISLRTRPVNSNVVKAGTIHSFRHYWGRYRNAVSPTLEGLPKKMPKQLKRMILKFCYGRDTVPTDDDLFGLYQEYQGKLDARAMRKKEARVKREKVDNKPFTQITNASFTRGPWMVELFPTASGFGVALSHTDEETLEDTEHSLPSIEEAYTRYNQEITRAKTLPLSPIGKAA